ISLVFGKDVFVLGSLFPSKKEPKDSVSGDVVCETSVEGGGVSPRNCPAPINVGTPAISVLGFTGAGFGKIIGVVIRALGEVDGADTGMESTNEEDFSVTLNFTTLAAWEVVCINRVCGDGIFSLAVLISEVTETATSKRFEGGWVCSSKYISPAVQA